MLKEVNFVVADCCRILLELIHYFELLLAMEWNLFVIVAMNCLNFGHLLNLFRLFESFLTHGIPLIYFQRTFHHRLTCLNPPMDFDHEWLQN